MCIRDSFSLGCLHRTRRVREASLPSVSLPSVSSHSLHTWSRSEFVEARHRVREFSRQRPWQPFRQDLRNPAVVPERLVTGHLEAVPDLLPHGAVVEQDGAGVVELVRSADQEDTFGDHLQVGDVGDLRPLAHLARMHVGGVDQGTVKPAGEGDGAHSLCSRSCTRTRPCPITASRSVRPAAGLQNAQGSTMKKPSSSNSGTGGVCPTTWVTPGSGLPPARSKGRNHRGPPFPRIPPASQAPVSSSWRTAWRNFSFRWSANRSGFAAQSRWNTDASHSAMPP